MASDLLQEAREGLDQLQTDGLQKAAKALDLFKQGGDVFGAYDALRVMISYHHQMALRDQRKPLDALKLAEDHLDGFRRQKDRCGEACMLLSLAEMNMDRRGRKKRDEALEQCLLALSIFQEQRTEKYEVMAQLILTNLYFKLDQPKKAQQAAEAALAKASDASVKGKALHGKALASAALGRYGFAAAQALQARKIFREEGDLKMEAAQLCSVAQWSLKASQPFQALKASEEALKIFQTLGYGKGWQSKALGYLCEALVALKQGPKAAKLAKDFQAAFEKAEDPRSAAQALQLQGFAWSGSATPERALEPLQAASEAHAEKGWHASILQDQASSCLAGGDSVAALQKLSLSVTAARSDQDRRQELRALRRIFRVSFDGQDFQAAMKAAGDARAVAKAAADPRGEAQDALRLAAALGNLGRYEEAFAAALEAQELCLGAAEVRGEAEALKVLSDLKRADGQLDAALEAAEERLTIVRNLGDIQLEIHALWHVAQLHLADGHAAEALQLALSGLQLSRSSDAAGRPLRVQLLLLLVEAQVAAGDVERPKVLRWSAEALALAGKVGDQSLRTLALYWRAYVWGILGRPSTGLSFAREARDLCSKLKQTPSEARCWLMIGQLLFAQGDKDDAMDAARTAQSLAAACGDVDAEVEVGHFMDTLSKKEQPPPEAAAPTPAAPSPAPTAEPAPEVSQAVTKGGLSPEEVGRQLVGFVKELTSNTEEVELDTAFIDAGMDSLSGVSLVSMLNRDFQTALTPSVVFDYPTIRQLQEYLIQESQT